MAKWMEVASRAALDELLGEPLRLTFARDASGGMRFYAGHVCVGYVPNDRLAALIQDSAALLQRRGPA
jgi:hypothetical protein